MAATVVKVSGPLVVAQGLSGARMFELVRVGREGLLGEVIEVRGDRYAVQVYEETEGIAPGEPAEGTGRPLAVELGPGCLASVYDGVQRPLDVLYARAGHFLGRGAAAPALDRSRRWELEPAAEPGREVGPGDTLGWVQETPLLRHRFTVPPGVSGRLVSLEARSLTVEEPAAVLRTAEGKELELPLLQRWPVRRPRPVSRRHAPSEPLVTGQRVIDTFFPLAKGGTACIPGPFGSGKTVVQHQLARWSDASVIVFVGCGERGNEMTDVLLEFPELKDPASGRPLLERTILVANTSNMPVAAREASVFTGMALAEYYRDMGYHVLLLADSTSRWAEAMREMSGRLQEMPGEEGYPAYLGSRLASFYERAGAVTCLGGDGRGGSLSVVGAVSPPGGDLSEPVVQATLRVTRAFWSLEDRLAFQRHFPAIGWLSSYSQYQEAVDAWAAAAGQGGLAGDRRRALALLQREAELEELARIVGMDALSAEDRLVLEGARMVREDFLHQSAFDPRDAYCSLAKQGALLALVLFAHARMAEALARGASLDRLLSLPFREEVARARLLPEGRPEAFAELRERVAAELGALP